MLRELPRFAGPFPQREATSRVFAVGLIPLPGTQSLSLTTSVDPRRAKFTRLEKDQLPHVVWPNRAREACAVGIHRV